MLVLGIESSCDETAAAVVDSSKNILANIVYSQVKEHKNFGGVIPELAAREHLVSIIVVIKEALSKANLRLKDIDAIASVIGPGLYGSLLVGSTVAKTLSIVLSRPFIAINHLEAHILTPRLLEDISFPYLALLISGGHSQYVEVNGVSDYKILGTTLDDALGEAFDKTARLLGYPYPGGKYIEILAKTGISGKFKFKAPLLNSKNCNFSFSGIKTAVSQKVTDLIKNNQFNQQNKANLAKSFEVAILESLKKKTLLAIEKFKAVHGYLNYFIVCGGVAANKSIRNMLKEVVKVNSGKFYAPPLNLCGDNAAMVSWAGIEKLKLGKLSNLDVVVKPNLSLLDNIN